MDTLRGGGGADSLAGGAGEDRLFGGAGDDTLDGGADSNQLRGEAGDDSLLGGAATDRMDGGTGADTMRGGAGNDVHVVDSAGDVVIELAGEGSDWVELSTLDGYLLPDGVENLRIIDATGRSASGNAANNAIFGGIGADLLRGLDGRDLIHGGAGGDTLDGGAGDDNLFGEAFPGLPGADLLRGGAGNDRLVGYDGADTLMGSAGQDSAVGGTGADVFRFDPEADLPGVVARLAIADFAQGEDRVLLPVPASAAGSAVVNAVPNGVSISGSFTGGGSWTVVVTGFDLAGHTATILPDLVLGVDLLWS